MEPKYYIGLYNELGYSIYLNDVNTEPMYIGGNSPYESQVWLGISDEALPVESIKDNCETTIKGMLAEGDAYGLQYDKDGYNDQKDYYLDPATIKDLLDRADVVCKALNDHDEEFDGDYYLALQRMNGLETNDSDPELYILETYLRNIEEYQPLTYKDADVIEAAISFETYLEQLEQYIEDMTPEPKKPFILFLEKRLEEVKASNEAHYTKAWLAFVIEEVIDHSDGYEGEGTGYVEELSCANGSWKIYTADLRVVFTEHMDAIFDIYNEECFQTGEPIYFGVEYRNGVPRRYMDMSLGNLTWLAFEVTAQDLLSQYEGRKDEFTLTDEDN